MPSGLSYQLNEFENGILPGEVKLLGLKAMATLTFGQINPTLPEFKLTGHKQTLFSSKDFALKMAAYHILDKPKHIQQLSSVAM